VFTKDIGGVLLPTDVVVPGDVGRDCLPCPMEGKRIVSLMEFPMWDGSCVDNLHKGNYLSVITTVNLINVT
jgi:hypothetical protein